MPYFGAIVKDIKERGADNFSILVRPAVPDTVRTAYVHWALLVDFLNVFEADNLSGQVRTESPEIRTDNTPLFRGGVRSGVRPN